MQHTPKKKPDTDSPELNTASLHYMTIIISRSQIVVTVASYTTAINTLRLTTKQTEDNRLLNPFVSGTSLRYDTSSDTISSKILPVVYTTGVCNSYCLQHNCIIILIVYPIYMAVIYFIFTLNIVQISLLNAWYCIYARLCMYTSLSYTE